MESWLGGNFKTSAKKTQETMKNSEEQWKRLLLQRRRHEKDSQIETIETTRIGKILETIDIRRESMVQTT